MTFVEFTIVWRVLIPFLAAFVSAAAGLWLCSLPMRRLPADAHWSEVARRYWPVRVARSLTLIWIVMAAYFEAQGRPHFHHEGWRIFMATVSALAGCLLGSRLAGRGLRLPEVLRRRNLRALPTVLFLSPAGPSILILVGLTWQMGLRMETFVITGVVLLVNIVLIMGASVAILKVLGLLREAGEPLQRIARGMAAENGVPLRHVFRIHLAMANAFAFGWTRDLGFTEAILETLDEDELRSVVSHELGHLKESLTTRWSRLTGLLIIPTIGLAPAAMVAGHPEIAIGLFAVWFLIGRWVSKNHKRMEEAADHEAHGAETSDGIYARALEKIHACGLIPAVLNPRHPYPSLYDRMISSGVTPDFPRPAAPNRRPAFLLSALAAGLFMLLSHQLTYLAVKVQSRRPVAAEREEPSP